MIGVLKKLSMLLAALLFIPFASAQVETPEEAPEPRRYSVEIVVFAYAEDVAVGTEEFPADKPIIVEDELPVDNADKSRPVPEPGMPATAKLDDDADSGTVLLERELMLDGEFTMHNVIERLERLDAYEPIMHVGWTQPNYPFAESQPIELAFFGKPPKGLAGSFTLYLGRYLHLVVDLALDAPGNLEQPIVFDERRYSYGDSRLRYADDRALPEGPVRYRIQEDRIVRNNDIRYFDHPKFGVIAKVTRVEKEDEETQAESPELVGRVGQ